MFRELPARLLSAHSSKNQFETNQSQGSIFLDLFFKLKLFYIKLFRSHFATFDQLTTCFHHFFPPIASRIFCSFEKSKMKADFLLVHEGFFFVSFMKKIFENMYWVINKLKHNLLKTPFKSSWKSKHQQSLRWERIEPNKNCWWKTRLAII